MQFNLARSIDILTRTPRVLDDMLGGIDDAWLRANEGPDTFSPFDVLGHLIDGDETDWIPRAQLILAQGTNRTFEPFDRFRHVQRNAGRSVESLLDEFAALRALNIVTMQGWHLTPDQLALRGVHPALGEVTLGQLLGTWTVHDLNHIAQATRVMANQYHDAVGPWQAYLRILQR